MKHCCVNLGGCYGSQPVLPAQGGLTMPFVLTAQAAFGVASLHRAAMSGTVSTMAALGCFFD
jgi:hypothetical protein